MHETKASGMQEITAERLNDLATGVGLVRGAVECISDDWISLGGKVHAKLMGAAGVQARGNQSKSGHAHLDGPVSARGAAIAAAGGHASAATKVAGHGKFDASSVAFYISVKKRDVGLLDFAFGKLLDELQVSLIGERHDQRAGGAFVEAVDDAGAQRAADVRKLSQAPEFIEERGGEGASGLTGAGVHDHAGGLIDYDDLIVLIEDGEREVFGLKDGFECFRDVDGDGFARHYAVGGFSWSAFHQDTAFVHQLLDANSAELRELVGQVTVQTRSFLIVGDYELELGCGALHGELGATGGGTPAALGAGRDCLAHATITLFRCRSGLR